MGNVCCEEQNKGAHEITNPQSSVRKIMHSSTCETTPNQKHQRTSPYGPHVQVANSSCSTPIPSIHQEVTQPKGLTKHGPENYQSIKYLGKGTFGDVVLAEDKQTGKQYAMKIIEKKKIKQPNVLQSEVIKKISQCELFVRIRQTFQNQTKIYIVMEYLPRGDIYYYLKKKTCVFREDIIKFLVAEIIAGIETLHSQGIIYRELKPENILVTNDGHIKLGDYGLSRMLLEEKNPLSTFIGTLEYTAPQALQGHYGKKADIWAIGILMYELKFEENLFEGAKNQTNDKVQKNIQSTNIQEILNRIVGKVSYDFRDVLIKLLQIDPEKRITLEQLKLHPFFQGIVWKDVHQRKNPAPLGEILQSDHIKFRDPNNYTELAHRKKFDTKSKEFQAKLYQFRNE